MSETGTHGKTKASTTFKFFNVLRTGLFAAAVIRLRRGLPLPMTDTLLVLEPDLLLLLVGSSSYGGLERAASYITWTEISRWSRRGWN